MVMAAQASKGPYMRGQVAHGAPPPEVAHVVHTPRLMKWR